MRAQEHVPTRSPLKQSSTRQRPVLEIQIQHDENHDEGGLDDAGAGDESSLPPDFDFDGPRTASSIGEPPEFHEMDDITVVNFISIDI